jgi:hypothetical protein
MADKQKCWQKTAHAEHDWQEEVDFHGEMRTAYHTCSGVEDVLPATKNLKFLRREGQATIYEVSSEFITLDNGVVKETRVERFVDIWAIYERTVIESSWENIQQLDCFCCSCWDPGDDHYCRNHNGGHGSRPCEYHGTPGQKIVDIDLDTLEEKQLDEYPESVQVQRAKDSEAHRNEDLWR